jgi:phage baseplate assembly protein W
MADRLDQMGIDLRLDYGFSGGFFEDADLASAADPRSARRERDLLTVDRVDAIRQAIANRLKTRRGELASLGHPDYGSRHHELMGEPNTERTRNLIKFHVLAALRQEPRIDKVLSLKVRPDQEPPRDMVRIEATVKLIDEPVPLNLVVPFSLEVGP